MSATTTSSPTATLGCQGHRDRLAGWYCDACDRALCGECTAEEVNRYFCVHCEGSARQLTVSRANLTFLQILFAAIAYPFRKRLALVIAVAIGLTLLSALGGAVEKLATAPPKPHVVAVDPASPAAIEGVPQVNVPQPAEDDGESGSHSWIPLAVGGTEALRVLLLCMVVFVVTGSRASGQGEKETAVIFGRVFYAFGATMIVWLPGIAYVLFVRRDAADGGMLTDWLAWLYAALFLAYVPIALAVCMTVANHQNALSPFALSEYVWKVRQRYTASLFAIALFAMVAAVVAITVAPQPNEILAARIGLELVIYLVVTLVVVQAAHLVGSLSYIYGYEFGAGTAADFYDPVLPFAIATGTLKKWASRLETVAGAHRENNLAREIARCLKMGEGTRAIRMFESQPDWAEDSFDADEVFALATAARIAKKIDLAQALLEALIDRKNVAGARALLALAKLYEVDRQDKATATELYKRVMEGFPGTDFAKFAKQRLEA